jgi:hypothetical protein
MTAPEPPIDVRGMKPAKRRFQIARERNRTLWRDLIALRRWNRTVSILGGGPDDGDWILGRRHYGGHSFVREKQR